MPGVQWAKELRDALRASGTGVGKLEILNQAILARYNDFDHAGKPTDHPDRHLTAAEGLRALQAAGVGEGTLDKARQLIATGTIAPPKPAVHPVDEIPLPTGTAPDRPAEPVVATTPIAGVVDVVGGDADTVGPKPVVAPPRRTAKVG